MQAIRQKLQLGFSVYRKLSMGSASNPLEELLKTSQWFYRLLVKNKKQWKMYSVWNAAIFLIQDYGTNNSVWPPKYITITTQKLQQLRNSFLRHEAKEQCQVKSCQTPSWFVCLVSSCGAAISFAKVNTSSSSRLCNLLILPKTDLLCLNASTTFPVPASPLFGSWQHRQLYTSVPPPNCSNHTQRVSCSCACWCDAHQQLGFGLYSHQCSPHQWPPRFEPQHLAFELVNTL